MATTPRGIVYPTTSNAITPLANVFASLATSADTAIDNALAPVSGYKGLTSAMGAAGQEGRTFYATDTNILWFDNGTAWKNRTPGIFIAARSSTGIINGSVAVTWLTPDVDTGGFFSAGAPTRITMPYTGAYKVAVHAKGNSVGGVQMTGTVNGAAPADQNWISFAGIGGTGAATSGQRVYIRNFTAGDYLIYTLIASAAQTGYHNISVEYLGES